MSPHKDLKKFVDDAHFCFCGPLLIESVESGVDTLDLILEYLETLANAQHDKAKRNLALQMRDRVMKKGFNLGYGAFDDLIDGELEPAQ